MKKKNIYIISISILVVLLSIFLINSFYYHKSKVITNETSNGNIPNNIAIMLETERGSGEYEESLLVNWPFSTYKYNSEISYCLNGSTLSYDETNSLINVNIKGSDKCYVYFDYGDWVAPNTSASAFVANYASYPDVVSDEKGNYRYSGSYNDVSNWICFGSTDETCPDNNLYRIIGVFNVDGEYEYKLIKGDYAISTDLGTAYGSASRSTTNPGHTSQTSIGTYQWHTSSVNTWGSGTTCTSSLCTKLNDTYLTNIGTPWASKIITSPWYVGGYSTSATIASTWYNYESSVSGSGSILQKKVGLMYLSDFGYAADSSYWSTNLDTNYANRINNDWLYNGGYEEWTISRYSSNTSSSYYLYSVGSTSYASSSTAYGVRPTFYLYPNMTITSGHGTVYNPYRISIDSYTYSETSSYSTSTQTFTAGADGYYKIQAWGAQGGNYSTSKTGGLGGYISGKIYLTEGTVLSITTGGQDGTNGGGASAGTGSYVGGGATIIKIGTSTIMTAAGGGGSSYRGNGGAGGSGTGAGGVTAGSGTGNTGTNGGGGSSSTNYDWCTGSCTCGGGCISYSCPSGGSVSGSTCTGSSYSLTSNISETCTCSGGVASCSGSSCSGNCNSPCATGYTYGTASHTSYGSDNGDYCSTSNSWSHVTDSYSAPCTWDGNYSASCSSYASTYPCCCSSGTEYGYQGQGGTSSVSSEVTLITKTDGVNSGNGYAKITYVS